MIIKILTTIMGVVLISSSSMALAEGKFAYRQPLQGVKASGNIKELTEPVEENNTEDENEVSCFDPANVGRIGTEAPCENMLIVNNEMLRAVASNNVSADGEYVSSGGGNETFSIKHDETGRAFSFSNSANNIFTGQVTDISRLFASTSFNGDIGYWDTSNVTDMTSLFANNASFNKDIGGWDTSNVNSMYGTFYKASSFNQDIGNWDTSNVTNMRIMFGSANSFNRDISGWDTSSVINMYDMFRNNQSFRINLSQWCVSSVTNYNYFAYGSVLSSGYYPVWGTCPRGEDL